MRLPLRYLLVKNLPFKREDFGFGSFPAIGRQSGFHTGMGQEFFTIP
jgi:hypothetical protein